jgi:hypothetical protein
LGGFWNSLRIRHASERYSAPSSGEERNMKSLASVLFVAAAVATAPVPAFSETPALAPNTYVRVQAPSLDSKPIGGLVVSMDGDMLVLRAETAR